MPLAVPVDHASRAQAPAASPSGTVKFDKYDAFRRALRARVDAYFAQTGRKPRDCWQMYTKTSVIFIVSAAAYLLLLFAAGTWWVAVPLAILLGLSLAAAGFNIQHDGGHGAYSANPWINKLSSMTLDLLGGSSYVWSRKHNAIHHSFTNITGHDDDINVGFLGRLSPHQKHLRFQRLQHFYLWVLYGFLPIKWYFYDDFKNVLMGRIGTHRFPRPRGWDLVIFIAGKAAFFAFAFGIPMLLHPFWSVLSLYVLASFVQGVVLSVVFQLAHCVEDAEFPMPVADTHRMEASWAVHQVETTVNFAPKNRLLAWLVGGLNFQIEHHLFPHICHIHYPAIAPLVQQTCKEFGLRYRVYRTFLEGMVSHFRWLRRMGMPNPA